MYYDGFIAEGLLTTESEAEPDNEFRAPSHAPTDEEIDPVTASSIELRRMGLTVIPGGRV